MSRRSESIDFASRFGLKHRSLSINVKRKCYCHLPHSKPRLRVKFSRALGTTLMPRLFFHLCAPDQDFRDRIGCDVNDLAAAHANSVQLADRVMMISAFSDRTVE